MEQLFRWISALIVLGAAIIVTLSVLRWAHPVVRPSMRFAVPVMWITFLYRLFLAATAFPSGTEWGRFIRLWLNVEFILLGLVVGGFGNATWQWHKEQLTIQHGNDRG